MKITFNLINLISICAVVYFSFEAKGATWVETKTYKISGTEIPLIHLATLHLLVSTYCVKKMNDQWDKNENCEAIKKLKIASLKKVVKEALSGGANPGAVVCLKLGGASLVALDSNSNQNSVCKFSDGSIISSGTLHYYARQNDRVKFN